MKLFYVLTLGIVFLIPSLAVGQSKGDIKMAIDAKYTPAKATDDHKDLTAAGAVIVLLKDNLAMVTTAPVLNDADGPVYAAPPTSTYKNGKFQANAWARLGSHMLLAGEKCWLIGIEVRDDAVILEFLSDPIDGARQRGFVKYPFPKGVIPPADTVMQQIAETIRTDSTQRASAGAPAQVASADALAPIAPPPPPRDTPPPAPKTISLGQTKEQVAAVFGPPTRVVTLPTKEIEFFPGMKVIFIKGKVADVQ